MSDAALIGVDWGTTRLRAWLLDRGGAVLAQVAADKGIQGIEPGGFAPAFHTVCGPWTTARPDVPVLMAGMIGSRNGWIETPYVAAPCGLAELARGIRKLPDSRIHFVPGVDCRDADAAYDVMRGEETMALGAGITDGLVCLPGTHSKWVEMRDGRIARFASFITGELYAALSSSFVARLASEPEAESHVADGLAAAGLPGGLPRALFQARTRVLGGLMPGAGVKPFISGLLVGAEIAGACSLFGSVQSVHLVAGEPQRAVYRQGLAACSADAHVVDPETAFLAGLRRLAETAGLHG